MLDKKTNAYEIIGKEAKIGLVRKVRISLGSRSDNSSVEKSTNLTNDYNI